MLNFYLDCPCPSPLVDIFFGKFLANWLITAQRVTPSLVLIRSHPLKMMLGEGGLYICIYATCIQGCFPGYFFAGECSAGAQCAARDFASDLACPPVIYLFIFFFEEQLSFERVRKITIF